MIQGCSSGNVNSGYDLDKDLVSSSFRILQIRIAQKRKTYEAFAFVR
jgi:hypothetical protein